MQKRGRIASDMGRIVAGVTGLLVMGRVFMAAMRCCDRAQESVSSGQSANEKRRNGTACRDVCWVLLIAPNERSEAKHGGQFRPGCCLVIATTSRRTWTGAQNAMRTPRIVTSSDLQNNETMATTTDMREGRSLVLLLEAQREVLPTPSGLIYDKREGDRIASPRPSYNRPANIRVTPTPIFSNNTNDTPFCNMGQGGHMRGRQKWGSTPRCPTQQNNTLQTSKFYDYDKRFIYPRREHVNYFGLRF